MIDLLVKIGATMMLTGVILGVGIVVFENIYPQKEIPDTLLWITIVLFAIPAIAFLYGLIWLY